MQERKALLKIYYLHKTLSQSVNNSQMLQVFLGENKSEPLNTVLNMVQHTCSVGCDATEGVRWPTVTGPTVPFSSTGPCTGNLCFILCLLKSHIFSKVRLTHLRSISWLPRSGVRLLLSTPKPLSYSDKHLAGEGGSMAECGFGVREVQAVFSDLWPGGRVSLSSPFG